mgnify:FL=1
MPCPAVSGAQSTSRTLSCQVLKWVTPLPLHTRARSRVPFTHCGVGTNAPEELEEDPVIELDPPMALEALDVDDPAEVADPVEADDPTEVDGPVEADDPVDVADVPLLGLLDVEPSDEPARDEEGPPDVLAETADVLPPTEEDAPDEEDEDDEDDEDPSVVQLHPAAVINPTSNQRVTLKKHLLLQVEPTNQAVEQGLSCGKGQR